jgi:hypothetical protein
MELGQRYRLTLRPEGRGFHELDAEAIGDYALKARGPISDKLLQELSTAKLLTVGATNVSSSLAFDISRINDILANLDSCRALIAKGQ